MKLNIFSVYDKAVHAYVQPFYARTKAEAVRMFSEACNDEKNNLHKHASDYQLMYLGEFDDQSGSFVPNDPVRIISALECVVDNPFTSDTELPEEGKPKLDRRLPM